MLYLLVIGIHLKQKFIINQDILKPTMGLSRLIMGLIIYLNY